MRRNTMVPRDLKMMVDRELESGERVRWMETPIPRFFTPAATGAFLFGIPWTAFAIFWTAMAAAGTAEAEGPGPFWLFPLFGVPFILVGFGMLSGPILARRKARKTVYVITDRRAISFEGGRSTTIRSFPPEKLGDVYRKEKKDGSGDVVIMHRGWSDSDGDRQTEELGFLRIADPREVEKKLRALAEKQ